MLRQEGCGFEVSMGYTFEISSQNKKQLWLLQPSFHLCNVFTDNKLYNIHKSCIGERQNGSEGRSDIKPGDLSSIPGTEVGTRTQIRDRDCETKNSSDSFMTMRGSRDRASFQS